MKFLVYIYFIFAVSFVSAQESVETLISTGNYKEAYVQIKKQLDEIYSSRVDDKRIPNDFISLGSAEERIDLNRLFAERKAEPYFLENNPELFKLHRSAGVCAFNLREYDSAVRHYYQCFRFKEIEFITDSVIFYELARVYKEAGYFRAYLNSLERACSLDKANASYALELGRALYAGRDKKRSIFYLERYLSIKGEAEDINDYILLANLHSDINRYLSTADYYRKYLAKKNDDAAVIFALAFICYNNVGSLDEALDLFSRALELLPADDILRRHKCNEYSGDILYRNLKFKEAFEAYSRTVEYEEKIDSAVKKKKEDIAEMRKTARELKTSLLKQKNY
ncbi:MAG: hypothetical protein KAZ87_13935, partial [Spirochaetes bacterium]|nr:hypothetical protein [Spirochaetota bacterium]